MTEHPPSETTDVYIGVGRMVQVPAKDVRSMKVLVPLDGSEPSMQAMERGLSLLKSSNPDVMLLCIQAEGFDKVDEDRRAQFEEDPDDEIFASEDEANEMLTVAKSRCKEVGIEVGTRVIEGRFEKVILEESVNYDLVLMHHLTRESFLEKIRMSRAEALVRALNIPVLLV